MEKIVPFYFLRHGTTQANLDGLMCGAGWDLPLSEKGLLEAAAVAKLFEGLQENRPTSVWASPLIRARQTAEIVNKVLNLPITFLTELREWEMGDWERATFASVGQTFLEGGSPPNGEARDAFLARVVRGLEQVSRHGGLPLIVSHGGVGMVLQQNFEIPRMRLQNGTVYRFSQKDAWTLQPLF